MDKEFRLFTLFNETAIQQLPAHLYQFLCGKRSRAGQALRIVLVILCLITATSVRAQSTALDFDGEDDYVTLAGLPNQWSNLLDDGFTITLRAQPASHGPASRRLFFIQEDTDNLATALINPQGRVYFWLKRNGTWHSTSGQTPLPLGSWSDLALRWEPGATETTIWADGERYDTSLSAGTSTLGLNDTFTIGSRTDGDQVFDGALDELRIWGTDLPADIIEAVASNVCVSASELVHEYDFEVGTPVGDNTGLNTLPDLVGSNPGTLSGFSLNGSRSNWVNAGRATCDDADFGITADVTPQIVAAGGQLTWTATLSSEALTNYPASTTVEIEMQMPAGTRFSAISADPLFVCSTPAVGASGTVSCTAADLPVPDTHLFSITTTVEPEAGPNTRFEGEWRIVQPTEDSDEGNNTATASAQISNVLLLVNDAATATDMPVEIDVLANDGDAPGGTGLDVTSLSVSLAAANGTAICASGSCSYSADSGFFGIDSFRYRVCDASVPQVCGEAVASITVPPVVVDDIYSMTSTRTFSGNVLDNDRVPTDAEVIAGAASNGSALVAADGSFSYTPDTDFVGIDSFDYTACLPSPNESLCDTGSVSITVAATVPIPSTGPLAWLLMTLMLSGFGAHRLKAGRLGTV